MHPVSHVHLPDRRADFDLGNHHVALVDSVSGGAVPADRQLTDVTVTAATLQSGNGNGGGGLAGTGSDWFFGGGLAFFLLLVTVVSC